MRRVAQLFVFAGALVAATRAATLSAAPIFINGGFETGDFSGWTVSGGAERGVATDGTPITGTLIPDNVVDVRSGNFAAFAKFQDNPASTLILEQTVDVEPGVPYSLSIRRGVFGSGTSYRWTNSLKVTFDNGSTGTISGGFQVGPSWTTTTVGTYTAAAGKTSATFRFELGGYETNSRGLAGFSIDDISIQEVPEPAGLGVIGLTVAALMRRRRPRLS